MAVDNAGAYTVMETREGPPLGYVDGKLYESLKWAQLAYRNALEEIPEDLIVGRDRSGEVTARELVTSSLSYAILNGVVAYLALNNMLGMMVDPQSFYRWLEQVDDAEFKAWLDKVAEDGSLTGVE